MADFDVKPVETPKEEKITMPEVDAKTPEVNVPETKVPEEKLVEESPKETPVKIEEPKKAVVESPKEAPKVEPEAPKEKIPVVESPKETPVKMEPAAPAPKTPEIEVPAKIPEPDKSEKEVEKIPEIEAPKVETPVKEPEIEKPKEETPETKTPEIEAPVKSPATETPKEEAPKVPDTKAPEVEAPKAKGPDVKASLAESLVTAVENVVVEAGSAAVKEFSKKTADDLKAIEKGLSQEVIEETKDGISLAEIGETIVDVVETIAEEIVEGAEIVIKDVKAHPELLAEGAIAVGIGIASIVQPELIVGSVAMFGKMAADRAKITANEIAVEASTHIVNELSKDLTEELAGHKLEATTTKTDTVKEEKSVDEATGTIVNKETTSSTKETTVVIDGKDVTPEPVVSTDAPKGSSKTEESAESSDPVKGEAEGDDDNEGPTVTVSSTTKTVSVKIDEDGTITIGTSAPDKASKGHKKKAKKEGVSKEAGITEKATESEKTVEKETKATTTPDKISTEEAVIVKEVDVPKVIKDVEKLAEVEVKPEAEVAKHLEKEIDKLIKQVSVPNELIEKPSALSVDLPHESLSQIHQKLDSLIASDTSAKGAVVAPIAETVTPDALEKIHLKLDALILSNSEAMKSAASKAEKDSEMVTQGDLEKLHAKLDKMQEALEIKPKSDEGFVHVHEKMDTIHEAILANAKSAPVEVAPEPVTKEVEVASVVKLDELHQKFETMQASINALAEALTQNLAAESTPAPIAEPIAESSVTTEEPSQPIPKTSEVVATPPVTTEILKDSPEAASTPKVDETEPTASEPVKAVDTKPVEEIPATPTTESKKPAVDPSKKHVKRSSFFGGFFG